MIPKINSALITLYNEAMIQKFPISYDYLTRYPLGYIEHAIQTALKLLKRADRETLVVITGIPRTTLYDTLVKLRLSEKVEKQPVQSRLRGRPRVEYKLPA